MNNTPDTPSAFSHLTADKLVELYVALRDKRDGVAKRHKAELAPFAQTMATIENQLLDMLNTQHQTSAAVPAGTYYKATRTSVTVGDWAETLAYIREHDAWELLEARVNKTHATSIMDETGAVIPGVNISRETTVQIRRA